MRPTVLERRRGGTDFLLILRDMRVLILEQRPPSTRIFRAARAAFCLRHRQRATPPGDLSLPARRNAARSSQGLHSPVRV